jgi:hypothetical protein
MNSPKNPRLFALAAVPMLAIGLFFALQMDTDDNPTGIPISPGYITPQGQGSEPPSIVPGDRETKIEYRNILFNHGGTDEAYGSGGALSAPPAGFSPI